MSNRRTAVTIVELLIAVAVIGVLLSIGYTRIPHDRFAVQQAAEGFVRDANLARFYAVSRNTYVRLEVDPASESYRLVDRTTGSVMKTVDLRSDARTPTVEIESAEPTGHHLVMDPRGIGIGLGQQTVVFASTRTDFSSTVDVSQQGRASVR